MLKFEIISRCRRYHRHQDAAYVSGSGSIPDAPFRRVAEHLREFRVPLG
jgi:hypothetical protein